MFKNLFSLEGRIALVTGGSRGIGKMIAGGFLAQGAAKVYITARKAAACEATAKELTAEYDGECIALPIDISTMAGIDMLAAEIIKREVEGRPGWPEASVAARVNGATDWYAGNFVEARVSLEPSRSLIRSAIATLPFVLRRTSASTAGDQCQPLGTAIPCSSTSRVPAKGAAALRGRSLPACRKPRNASCPVVPGARWGHTRSILTARSTGSSVRGRCDRAPGTAECGLASRRAAPRWSSAGSRMGRSACWRR